MKRKNLPYSGKKLFSTLTFLAACTLPFVASAQLTKNYANAEIAHSTGSFGTNNVTDFANASDENETTSATLNASTTVILSTLSYVEIGFPTNVPQGSTVYIAVQDDPSTGLLTTLAGGTLGNIVTGLLSNRFIEVTIKDNLGNEVVEYSSDGNQRTFSEGTFNVVTGKDGQRYITFRANPGVNFDRVRVTARTGGLIGASYQIKVQDAFYLSGTYDPCNPFVTTSFDATGITLSLLNNNGDPVKNPERAIDDDTTNFSTFGYGVANVALGSTFSQDFYFSNLSKPGDQVKLKFRFPSSLLTANVLNTITVNAYRHDTLVSSSDMFSLLSAEVLALLTINLNNNIPTTVQFAVDTTAAQTLQFDRVRLSYTQLANGSLNEFMEVYGIDRVPAAPEVLVPSASNCPGTTMHLSITNVLPGTSYKWYDSTGAVVSSDTFYNAIVPGNGVTANYYVTSSNCVDKESIGTQAAVTGNTATCIAFSPVAFLESIFDGTKNKDVTPAWAAVLAANATNQPYNTPEFQYAGTESVLPSIFTSTAATDDVVDWILLELKDSAGNAIDRKAVLLLENGQVANIDKSQPVVMKANPGMYHLTLRHRNHLGLSSNLIPYGSGDNIFDFSTATDAQLFGDANAFITIGGTTAMRGGNVNGNFNIRFNGTGNDRDAILFFLGGNEASTIFNVYTPADLNMDGMVRFNGADNDRDLLLLDLSGSEFITIFEQRK